MAAVKGSILVTGANGGLGAAIVNQIASSPDLSTHHGLYTVRDANSAPALNTVLKNNPSHPHDVLSLDLTDLANVRSVAQTINTRVSSGTLPPLRALILNAGFQDFGHQTQTKDGLDTTFVSNYLGHWLLTLLLLQSIDKSHGRIVILGSQSHDKLTPAPSSPEDKRNAMSNPFSYKSNKYRTMLTPTSNLSAIAHGTWSPSTEDPSWHSGFRRYGAAKLCCVMMLHELQARLDRDASLKDICVLGVDPGAMSTSMARNAPWFIRVLIFKVAFRVATWWGGVRTVERSAGDVVWGAMEGVRGGYFDGRKAMETSGEAREREKREVVWRESVGFAGLGEGETVLGEWR
ncbi:putative short-chain dehydrogenase [Polyplosphaeria fusca]|uniref:3beta-hydroxysteroid 3-dehydrogenase n=1 Tax=Polyplosphaeria fusca TaxID=682080 RepID=A0A9P4QUP1_9PLEO|nr:putative short-chain dehydrogenase [Polyplosphaeria fusca]